MNCQIFETVVNDLAREQMIEANAREQALAHSGECEGCALRLALERQLTLGLRALAAEMKSVSASARLEEHLREAFRSQASTHVEPPPVGRRRYWLVAAAAVVLIAFGIAGLRWRPDRPPTSATRTSGNPESQSSPRVPDLATVQLNTESPQKQTKAFHLPRRNQVVRRAAKPSSGGNDTLVALGTSGQSSGGTNTTETGNSEPAEITTEFLPLSYVSPVGLQDGGQLVRVELPRSAMVSLGLPVNMERYSERVKADVLVSADGLARAIRFVQ